MEAPFLGLMIVLSLGLAGVLEALAQVSSRSGGGLALARSEAEVPRAVRLAYLYLPTTVAVAYGLLWTCVDVDVRRVQPWLALSRPGGARGDQSLLLDYPVDSLPLLPFRAGRRGHWPVMLVGLVMMGVSGVITPLQSAILYVGILPFVSFPGCCYKSKTGSHVASFSGRRGGNLLLI